MQVKCNLVFFLILPEIYIGNSMKRRVALYPGSFNPMHIGHAAIARWLAECGGFDEVRLMPSPGNPLKCVGTSAPADTADKTTDTKATAGTPATTERIQRLESVEAAVKRNGLNVKIEDIEFRLPPPHYTYRTLEALHKREPGTEFILVIGSDNLAIIDTWYKGREILSEYETWVYPRDGYDTGRLIREATDKGALRIRMIEAPLIDISSTAIRNAEACGDMSMEKFKA